MPECAWIARTEAVRHDLEPRSRIPDLDLAHLPPDDPAVYTMLQEADTIGMFQVESRAQMATLPRLKPQYFYDLVVEVAIIRPGPIVGQDGASLSEPPAGREAGDLPASVARAGTRAHARRAACSRNSCCRWRWSWPASPAARPRNCAARWASSARRSACSNRSPAARRHGRNGITGKPADEIVRSITSFALYGFPESHAASFALLVYASAYLKAHYPAAFYTALLNNQPMGFYHPATLVKDAQRRGVRFAPIDVQVSDWECRVDPDGRVRLGLMYVNGLRAEVGKRRMHRAAMLVNRGLAVQSAAPAAAPSANARGASEQGVGPRER